jgi:MFS family permease
MGLAESTKISRGQWMALAAALLGWMFDGLEMGLFPVVARPALRDLLQITDDKRIGLWISVATAAFLVGAATGGVLFGWLGDRIGRVRAMTLSVLTYALFSGLCGFAGEAWQIAGLRFLSALGMGGEWCLGVALVMEIWPDHSRGLLAGLIGAAGNFGYLLIALLTLALGKVLAEVQIGLLKIGLPESWVTVLVAHSGWRLLMFVGAAPALLTFFIRLFVPESQRWQQEQARGTTSNWEARDLLGVAVGTLAAGSMIFLWAAELSPAIRLPGSALALIIVTLGYAYPVLRYLQRSQSNDDWVARPESSKGVAEHQGLKTRPSKTQGVPPGAFGGPDKWPILRRMFLGAALGGVPLLGTWASILLAPSWADQLTGGEMREAKAYTQLWSALGAIIATFAAALIGDWLGRRITYCLLCLGSLASALFFFQCNDHFGPAFLASVFLAGGLTASFYGWLPLYLPEIFPTRVRAIGQGFSFNFGRILAAVGALQTGNLMGFFGGYPQACSIMSLIYLVGLAIIWLAPETRGQPLPE